MSEEIAKADTVAGSGRGRASADGRTLAHGSQLGRYTILEFIGAGGMGHVCAAYDPNLDRKVAIKVLRSDQWGRASEHLSARLLREAQAMAKLSHPNVVTVFEAGTLGDLVFIAMEFIDGVTLSSHIAQSSPTWQQIIELFLKAGEGLAAAHDARMVHRDFKPDNVIIGKDNQVRVTDFGLVRYDGDQKRVSLPPLALIQLRDPASQVVTEDGVLMGTPGYMSPEQLQMKDCDARSDQFSFGVSLWEALYGELPFAGNTIASVAVAIDANEVRPPTHSRVPRSMRKAILRSIRCDPAERFESMHVLLAHMRRSLGWRRRRWMVVPAIALVAGVTGFAFTRSDNHEVATPCTGGKVQLARTWNDTRRSELKATFKGSNQTAAEWSVVEGLLDKYGQEWADMHRDACVATRVSGEQSETILDRRMLCLDRRRVQLGAFIDLLQAGTGPALREATKSAYELPQIRDCANIEWLTNAVDLPADPAIKAQVEKVRSMLARSNALAGAGLYENALTDARGAAEQATQSRYQPVEAEALLSVGLLQWQSGNPSGSEEQLLRAVEVAETSHHVQVKTTAQIELVNVVGYELERTTEGLTWGRLAAASLEASGNDPLLRARLLNNLANVVWRTDDLQRCLDLLRQALEIRQQVLGENHPDVAASHDNVSTVFLGLHDYAQALFHSKKALELRLRLLGAQHPLVAESHNNLGNIYFEQGLHEDARKEFQTGLNVWQASLGAEHPNIAIALTNLAVVDDVQDRADDARAKYQRAVEIEEKALGPTHPQVAESLQALALHLKRRGQTTRAIEALERAAGIRQKAFGVNHKLTITTTLHLADARLALGDTLAARDLLERSLVQQDFDKVDPAVSGQAMFELAQLLWPEAAARGRSMELARRGRANLVKAGATTDNVDRWLAARPKFLVKG